MILITGATGRTGGALLSLLQRRGQARRALTRDPEKAARALPPGTEIVRGDLTDPASLRRAARGADSVFLLWPSGDDERAAESVAALASEVGRIVYLSTIGVPADPSSATDPITASHAHLEHLIGDCASEWTFVRSGGMAANTLGWADGIRTESVVREAFGGVPRPLVHERDLAEIAALALTEDGHVGRHHDITGPQVVTGEQQVAAIATAIGRPLRLESLSRDDAVDRLSGSGFPRATVEQMVDAWSRMIDDPEPPTPDFHAVTGHPGTPFAQWARDHRADFA